MTIKAVIFDMDGVLVDSEGLHLDSLNMALKKMNYTLISKEENNTLSGLSTKQKLNYLFKEKRIEENLIPILIDLKNEYTKNEMKAHIKSNKQLEGLLNYYSNKYTLCLCSNASRKTVDIFLNIDHFRNYFKFMLSGDDVKNQKPNSEIYDTVIKKLNFLPLECLIIEDSIAGVTAAKASGANVLEVKNITEVNIENIDNKINSLI